MNTAYKIFEERDGKLFNLFYAIGRRKQVEFDKTHQAVERLTYESSAKTKYVTGFHCVKSLALMPLYLKRFSKARMPRLVVVEVKVSETRKKPTKGSLALLAKQIRIESTARRWKASDLIKK